MPDGDMGNTSFLDDPSDDEASIKDPAVTTWLDAVEAAKKPAEDVDTILAETIGLRSK